MRVSHAIVDGQGIRRTRVSLWCNGSQFDIDSMTCCVMMRKSMSVSSKTPVQGASASQRAAGQTQPEVLFQITGRAVRQTYSRSVSTQGRL